jgi:hypothetical protein
MTSTQLVRWNAYHKVKAQKDADAIKKAQGQ